MRVLLIASVVVMTTMPNIAYGQFFLGSDFQVNSSTVDGHRYPSVSAAPYGDFVVVWERLIISGGVDLEVNGRLFAADGSPRGDDFQVNLGTVGYQEAPAVAVDANGDFLVVWQSDSSSLGDTSGSSIQAARFDSDGTAATVDLQVNSYTSGDQRLPAVAAAADGTFVAVWQSDGSDGTDTQLLSIQGQLLNHNGGGLGSQFQVNTFTPTHQAEPSVAAAGSSGFVVVWMSGQSSDTDNSNESIQGQRFAWEGAPLGSQFQVNTYTTGVQRTPKVAAGDDGTFVVVWTSFNQDGDYAGIFGQRFASGGSPLGNEFQVNTFTTNHQGWPKIAMKSDGEFVVVWESQGSVGPDLTKSIQGQLFAADGRMVGGQFQVNLSNAHHEVRPSVAIDGRGNVVAAWKIPDVTGRRFFSGIFVDGFESSDTSAWSSSVP